MAIPLFQRPPLPAPSHRCPRVIQSAFPGNRLPGALRPPRLPGDRGGQLRTLGPATQLPPTLLAFPPTLFGRRLPEVVRRRMEAALGADFSDVRAHVGREVQTLGALAFTQGSDLYFAPGQYNPSSPAGLRLLGHELTHVVQQRAGRVRNPFGSGLAVVQDPAMEAEAERLGIRAASHVQHIQTIPSPAPPQAPRQESRALQPKWKNNAGNEYLALWSFLKENFPEQADNLMIAVEDNEQLFETAQEALLFLELWEEPQEKKKNNPGIIAPNKKTKKEPKVILIGYRDLYNEELQAIWEFLPAEDLNKWTYVNKNIRGIVGELVKKKWKGEGRLQGVHDWRLLMGALRAIERYPTEPEQISEGTSTPSTEKSQNENSLANYLVKAKVGPENRSESLYGEVLRSLIWRDYSSELRLKKTEARLTPEKLTKLIDDAYLMTKWLREEKNALKLMPISRRINKQNDETMQAVARHWAEACEKIVIPEKPHELDEIAEMIYRSTGGKEKGQNWTVAKDKPKGKSGRYGIYSNIYREDLKTHVQEIVWQYLQDVLEVTDITYMKVKNWGLEEGIGRNIFFHSEMHRTLNLEPWELGYGGNHFLACIQCMAAYYAMGISKGFRGSHGCKISSIIPPKIRFNPVYLRRYLGETAWKYVMDLPVERLGEFLDALERETEKENGPINKILDEAKIKKSYS